MELQPGAMVERYVVEEELGRGGMAVVYKVRHQRLGSLHALKLLSLTSRSLQERLLQEGQVQATLRHPNVVAVTDVLDVQGQPGLVMEFVEGPTLEDWLHTHRPNHEQAESIFRGVLSAVEAAHQKDLVHRDLKPANVLLASYSVALSGDRSGERIGEVVPKVTDFGLAKALAEVSSGPGTRSGVSMGTPKYMAPEQIRDAGGVDKRADLFSLGAILYELVTGRPPFDGPDVLSVFNAVASGSFAELPEDVPEHLARAVRGCLVVDPRARLPDCGTLRAVLDGRPVDHDVSAHRAPSVTMVPGSFGADSADTWSPELAAAQVAAAQARAAGGGSAGVESAVAATVPTTSAPDGAGPAMHATLVPDGNSLEGSLDPGTSSPPPPKRLAWFLTGGGLAVAGVGAGLVALVVVLVGGWFALAAWHAAAVRAFLADATAGEVEVGEVVMRPGHVLLTDVTVEGRDGKVVASAPRVRLVGESFWFVFGLDALDDVIVEGMTVDLREGADGLVLPAQTMQLVRGERGEGTSVRDVDLQLRDVRLTARTDDGVLTARLDGLEFNELSLDEAGWRADDITLTNLFVDGAQPIAKVVEITASSGEARVRGLELWVRSRRDGRMDLPPVVADAVPAYLGGHLEEGRTSWFVHGAEAVPIGIDEVRVETGSVYMVDTAHAERDVTWTLALDQASGTRDGTAWRVTALGMVHGGRATLEGGVDQDGAFEGRLDVRDVPLPAFSPYLDADLADRGVKVEGGLVQGVFEVEERGEALGWHGVVELEDVALAAIDEDGRLRVRERRLLAPRESVVVKSGGIGVLSDRSYQPVEDLRVATVEALLEPAGGVDVRRRVYELLGIDDEEPDASLPDEQDLHEPPEDAVASSEKAPVKQKGPAPQDEDVEESTDQVRIPPAMRDAWRRKREETRKKLEEVLKRR